MSDVSGYGTDSGEQSLSAYILAPRGTMPGTSTLIRLREAEDLDDLMAYLRREGG